MRGQSVQVNHDLMQGVKETMLECKHCEGGLIPVQVDYTM